MRTAENPSLVFPFILHVRRTLPKEELRLLQACMHKVDILNDGEIQKSTKDNGRVAAFVGEEGKAR